MFGKGKELEGETEKNSRYDQQGWGSAGISEESGILRVFKPDRRGGVTFVSPGEQRPLVQWQGGRKVETGL